MPFYPETSTNDWLVMLWSMTYVATPIAVAVREACLTPSQQHVFVVRAAGLYRSRTHL